jgi:uncharacterized protein (DUF433 family)
MTSQGHFGCWDLSSNRTQEWPPRTSPDQTKRFAIQGRAGDREPLVVSSVEPPGMVRESLAIQADRPPLRVDEGEVIRIGKSRVSLDIVIEQYEKRTTPEDIVRAYDTLELADVHAAIAYYLRHRDEVRAYLKRREAEAEALRAKIEAERPRVSREELLARRTAREKADAPTGQ